MATYTGADKALAFLFDIAACIAADYDDSATYTTGDYVLHGGTLYKCITTISTPEAFTPAHWLSVLVMSEIEAGGGGGTTVIANPPEEATDILFKIKVAETTYSIQSGGGSGEHIYSTTEHEVGKWIDGSTIYEKTYTGRSIAINADNRSWIDTGIDATAVKTIISAFGIDASGQYYPLQVVIFSATKTFGVSFQCQVNRTITIVTFQYTKNNDTTVYRRTLENGDIRKTEAGDTRTTENIAGV